MASRSEKIYYNITVQAEVKGKKQAEFFREALATTLNGFSQVWEKDSVKIIANAVNSKKLPLL